MAGESKGKEKDASAKEKRRKHRRHESKDNEASSLNENPEAPKEKTHKKHHKRNSNSNSKASPPSSPMTSPISTPNGSPEREKSPMNKRTSKSDDKGKGKQKEKEKDGEKKEEKQQNVVAENEGGSGTLRGRRKKGSSSRQLRSSNSTDNLNRISKTAVRYVAYSLLCVLWSFCSIFLSLSLFVSFISKCSQYVARSII